MTTTWHVLALQHGPDDDASSTYSTEGPDSRATSTGVSPCSQDPTSPCRASPSPKPLRNRVSGVPPLSGQRSLAPAAGPARLPATPLRRLQIASPDRELHQGRIYRHPERHLLVGCYNLYRVAASSELILNNVSMNKLLSINICCTATCTCFFGSAVLYCTVLYCTVLYCTVLYCYIVAT